MKIFVKMEDLYKECQFCLKIIIVGRNYKFHFTPRPCNICKKVFACQRLQKQHEKGCSFSCEICCIKIKSSVRMAKHLQRCRLRNNISSGYVLFTCNFCSRTFLNKGSLSYHIARNHLVSKTKVCLCDLCYKNFSTEWKYKNHMMETHNVNLGIFQCSICFQCLKTAEYLKDHMKQKHFPTLDINYVECDLCNRKIDEANLEGHKQTRCSKNSYAIQENNFYKCPSCDYSNSIKYEIKRHIHNVHIQTPKNLTCSMCSEVFATADKHSSHFCASRKKETCSHCGLKMYREFLFFHSVADKCDHCNILFPCFGSLSKHRFEKVACFWCKMVFCDGDLREKHMTEMHDFKEAWEKLQLEDLGHKCYHCRIYFLNESFLSQHMLTKHPVSFCDLCGTLCKDQTDLHNHLYEKHGCIKTGDVESRCQESVEKVVVGKVVNPVLYKCTVCSKNKMKRDELEAHLKYLHSDYIRPTSSLLDKMIGKQDISEKLEKFPHTALKRDGGNEKKSSKFFLCPSCNFKQSKKCAVLQHMIQVHNAKSYTTFCSICKKSFENLYRRKTHFCETRPKEVCQFCKCTMYSEYLAGHQLVAGCIKCNKMFSCENLLQIHQFEEHTCQHCNQVFCELKTLITHLEETHNAKLDMSSWEGYEFASLGFPCYKCKCFFSNESNHSIHKLIKHPDKTSCELCGVLLGKINQCRKHCEEVHGAPKSYKITAPAISCKMCNTDFKDIETFVKHVRPQFKAVFLNSIVVKPCNHEMTYGKLVYKVFFKNNAIWKKLMSTKDLIVAQTREFICDACGMDFDTEETVGKHVMSKHHPKSQQQNRDLSNLKNPNQIACGKPKNLFYCSCKANFILEENLVKHIQICHISNGVKCLFCSRVCNSFDELKSHAVECHQAKHKELLECIKIQREEFICVFCDQHFLEGDTLLRHYSLCHFKERPSCKICREEFTDVESLKQHAIDKHGAPHENIKRFACKICNKKIISLAASEIHIFLAHMSSSKYCNICLQTFVNKESRGLHKDQQINCSICRAKFCYEENYKSHIRTNHFCLMEEAAVKILLEHNYSASQRFGPNSQIFEPANLEQINWEPNSNLDSDPLLNSLDGWVSGEVKEEVFD